LGLKAFKSSLSFSSKILSIVGVILCSIDLLVCFWFLGVYTIGAIAYYIFGLGKH
jgi:hypothetical protein